MIVKVKNLLGTSDNSAPYGYSSWLDFWEKSTGRKANKCANIDCNLKATVGAHVIKTSGTKEWYIVPLCDGCNNYHNEDGFFVNDSDLVKANQ